jgi:hypothetical protein
MELGIMINETRQIQKMGILCGFKVNKTYMKVGGTTEE